MILVCGAAGKTGLAAIHALAARGVLVRAWMHDAGKVERVMKAGAAETVIGDMLNSEDARKALDGISAVYHICPNVHPHEVEIGENVISTANAVGVSRFVYHSVLHPQVEAMPHHWKKMRVEEALIASGLAFTILQPASYMQNVLANWDVIRETGTYSVPYSIEAKLSMVDLQDVAEAAAIILTEAGHEYGTCELAGPEALSQVQIAEALSESLGRDIQARETPISEWRTRAQASGLGEYQIDALSKMFEYYDRHGLIGNPTVLARLLRHNPATLKEVLARHIAGE